MTQFSFHGDYDAYGQPRSQIAIAVPRGRDFRVDAPGGRALPGHHTVTTYAQRDDAQRYLVDRVARARPATRSSTTARRACSPCRPAILRRRRLRAASSARRCNFYDGPAFEGLPFGQLGDYGVVVRTESLVLTEEILHEAYKSGDTVQTPPEVPPYLAPRGTPAWTAEYPQEFRDLLPPLAGYIFQPGDAGSRTPRGYFAATERRRYDCQDDPAGPRAEGCSRPAAMPLGQRRDHQLRRLRPAADRGHRPGRPDHQAAYDYRVLQPREVTDPNGNRTAFAFTPLGLLESTAVMGKAGEHVGDTPDVAEYSHGLRLPGLRRAPAADLRPHHPAGASRQRHRRAAAGARRDDRDGRVLRRLRAAAADPTPGGGRRLRRADASAMPACPLTSQQPVGRRDRATPHAGSPPRVVVSGWQIYDNKGRVVEKYEPFFATGWDYAPPSDAQLGQKVTMFYDPRGQVVRTVNPDGSEQRVILGVPADSATIRTSSRRRPGRPTPTTPTTTPAAPTRPRRRAISSTGTRRPASWSTRWAARSRASSATGRTRRPTGSSRARPTTSAATCSP